MEGKIAWLLATGLRMDVSELRARHGWIGFSFFGSGGLKRKMVRFRKRERERESTHPLFPSTGGTAAERGGPDVCGSLRAHGENYEHFGLPSVPRSLQFKNGNPKPGNMISIFRDWLPGYPGSGIGVQGSGLLGCRISGFGRGRTSET